MRKRNGFTLTEVLAVVSILAAIMIIATPIVLKTINQSKKIITEEDKKTAIDSAEAYLSDIENGLVIYKAPTDLTINDNSYHEGDNMKTYDAISYIISVSDSTGIEIPIQTLVDDGYLDEKCNYETSPKKCKFKSTCTFTGYMDGDIQDGYNVVLKYRAKINDNCN